MLLFFNLQKTTLLIFNLKKDITSGWQYKDITYTKNFKYKEKKQNEKFKYNRHTILTR